MKDFVLKSVFGIGFIFLTSSAFAISEVNSSLIARGRYLVKITGCNDCHTPHYAERSGEVPENEWLIGVRIGYKGAWGTTYPANLRHELANATEAEWVHEAKHMRTKPPMPWFNLNAMSTADLKAMYHFIRSLGDSDNPVPAELPPGMTPTTPYINFEVIVPTPK